MTFHSPIILIGRGGSGTRLLSEMAVAAGFFLGNTLNQSWDSEEWVDLVYRIVIETGGQRDLPRGSRFRAEIRNRAQNILREAEQTGETLWGWKLPETILVLPLFLNAFPEAKIIHLVRHPISGSLRRSHMTSRLGNPVGDVVLPAAYGYAGRDLTLIHGDETYLHNAYSWNFQVSRVVDFARATLSERNYIELRYEDVCRKPEKAVANVRSFVGLSTKSEQAIPKVDVARLTQWEATDPRVNAIWAICGKTASILGYQPDI